MTAAVLWKCDGCRRSLLGPGRDIVGVNDGVFCGEVCASVKRSDAITRPDETRARASREFVCVVKARAPTSPTIKLWAVCTTPTISQQGVAPKCPHGYTRGELCPFCERGEVKP